MKLGLASQNLPRPEETVDVLLPDAAHLETKKPLFLAWSEALPCSILKSGHQ